MDPRRLRQLFLSESREHLGAACGELDCDLPCPDETEFLRSQMRHAHSLKGMAMSLGLGTMVGLAHAMEDLFESLLESPELRDDSLLPLIREGWIRLGVIVDAVEREESDDDAEAKRLIERFRDPRREQAPFVPAETRPSAGPRCESVGAAEEPLGEEAEDAASPCWRVELELLETAPLAAEETVAVVRALGRAGRVHHVSPPLALDAAEGEAGRLVAVISTETAAEELKAALLALPEVTGCAVKALPAERRAAGESEAPCRWARVRAELLDDLLEQALELFREHRQTRLSSPEADDRLGRHLDRSEFLLKRLYGVLTELRLVPIDELGQRLALTVHTLSRELAKPAQFEIKGGEIQVDRSVLDALVDPLQHMIRNAIDHGVEPAPERAARGKPAQATLTLEVERRGERLLLSLEDDGRGIDVETLRLAAVARGMIDAEGAARLSDADCYELITLPAFSTTAQATRVSGRGIGMDVVRRNVEHLGGRLSIRSEPGRRTRVEMDMPMTLALVPALLLRCAGQLFALPLGRIRESDEGGREPAGPAPGERGEEPRSERPVIRLRDHISAPPPAGRPADEATLLLDSTYGSMDIVVDEILGKREIVVRPLRPPLNELRHYAGAALLEDGSIALVLDPDELLLDRPPRT